MAALNARAAPRWALPPWMDAPVMPTEGPRVLDEGVGLVIVELDGECA
jgi:hypothetical protein